MIEHLIIPAPPALEQHVKCFWVFRYSDDSDRHVQVRTFANESSGITILLGNGFVKANIKGQVTKPERFQPAPSLHVFGAQFFPYTLHELFGIKVSAFTDQEINLNEFAGWNISDAILNENAVVSRIKLLSDFLHELIRNKRSNDTLVKACASKVYAHNGLLTVTDLRKHFAISERQLERRFSEVIGVSPRHYIKVTRFQHAIEKLRKGQFTNLTDLAMSLDYTDQSHFIRHIKQLSGLTPKQLHRKLVATEVNQTGNTPYLVEFVDRKRIVMSSLQAIQEAY